MALIKLLTCINCSECLNNNGGCDSKRTCTNTKGGRTCGDCPSGYANDGDTDCKGEYIPVSESNVLMTMLHVLVIQT